MRNSALIPWLILFFAIITVRGFSQFAIAGAPGLQYHDVIPDTILQGDATYSIDINQDGSLDIGLATYTFNALGG